MQALREHCSLSEHDPGKNPRSPKQKQNLAPVQPAMPLTLTDQLYKADEEKQKETHAKPAVPLILTVQPEPDQVEIDMYNTAILLASV